MASPRSCSHGNESISSIGCRRPSASGRSSCGPWVTIRGHPTSAMSSSRSSSCSSSSACLQLTEALLAERPVRRPRGLVEGAPGGVDARCMSAVDASATAPMTCSVAGLTTSNVPASPSTSLPSISSRDSCCGVGRSAMSVSSEVCAWCRHAGARMGDGDPGIGAGQASPKRSTVWALTPSGSSWRATR